MIVCRDVANVFVCGFFFLLLFHFQADQAYEYYDNLTELEMPNSTVQDHRQLTEWSQAGSDSVSMPLDMTFNDGHRLSIIVYRYAIHSIPISL